MSSKTMTEPIPETGLFYSAASLSFARGLLSDLEDELKEKAMKLTREAGRDTVTEEDMRQAADCILGTVGGDVNDPSSDDA